MPSRCCRSSSTSVWSSSSSRSRRVPTATWHGCRSGRRCRSSPTRSCVLPEDLDALVGVVAGINVKLAKCGGIGPAQRDARRRPRELGFRTFLGCMEETSVGIAGSAVVASLAEWVDLDGNLLLADDPFEGLDLGPDKRWRLTDRSGPRARPQAPPEPGSRTFRTGVLADCPPMWKSSWMKSWTSPLPGRAAATPYDVATPVAADPGRAGPDTRTTVRRTVSDTTVRPGWLRVAVVRRARGASLSGRRAPAGGRVRHRWNHATPPRESPTRMRPSSSVSATAADAWAGRSCMTRCAPSRHAACSAVSGVEDLAGHGIGFRSLRHAGPGRDGVRDHRRGASAPPAR